MIPVIGALRDQVDLPLSIDTFRVDVAKAALDAGASWLNDVSGLRTAADEGEENPRLSGGMAALAACRRVPLVLMNNRAPPHSGEVNQDTRSSPPSDDIVADVGRELAAALELARGAGVARWHRIIDPGIGFGKTVSQHAALIARLDQLTRLGYPLLFGCSRKGFLGKMSGGAPRGGAACGDDSRQCAGRRTRRADCARPRRARKCAGAAGRKRNLETRFEFDVTWCLRSTIRH